MVVGFETSMQSLPITTNVKSFNPAQVSSTRYNITLYVIKFVSDLQQVGGPPRTEIFWKVALDTIASLELETFMQT